ncbi:MAG: HAMP domain-containing protein [Cyanobacteria bacterium CRU_2_1]|nr:HAMP domain-containing protein [Cyanobacteria bacterium RU_5_0]NJR57985.1 HAMP domain-containing protein [Cyanobacteria bacterium CRU_2_1]
MSERPLKSTPQNANKGEISLFKSVQVTDQPSATASLSSLPTQIQSFQDQPSPELLELEESEQEEGSEILSQPRSTNWWQRISVKTKVTALAVTLGVLPVLLVGGSATYFANRIIVQEALEERQRLAVDISLELNRLMENRLQNVETIITNPLIADPETRQSTAPEDLVKFLDSFAQRESSNPLIATVSPEGAFIYLAGGRIPLRSSEMAVPSNSDTPSAKPFAEFNAAYLLQTQDTFLPAVTPLRVSDVTGEPSLYLVAPLLDPLTQELAYLVYNQITPDDISLLIQEKLINLIYGGRNNDRRLPGFKVIDHRMSYYEKTADEQEQEIAPTRIEVDSNSIKIDGKPFQPGETFFTKQDKTIASGDDETLNAEIATIFPKYAELRSSETVTTTLDISQQDGQEYLLTYAPVPQIEGLYIDWGVLTYEPTSTVFAAQKTLILTLSLGTIVTALVLGTIAATIASRATRPIIEAADAVEKIGRGELKTRVNVEGEDEVATLGFNINQMANQLQGFLDAQRIEAERERLLAAAKGSGAMRTADLEAIFSQVIQDVRELLKLEGVILYRLHSNWNNTIPAEFAVLGLPHDDVNEEFSIPDLLLERCQQGEIVTVDSANTDLPIDFLRQLETLSIEAGLMAPIWSGDRLFGVILVHDSTLRDWQPTEITFLQQLATELGLSVYRAELLEQTEKLAQEQRQLKEGLQRRALELLQDVDPISKGDLTIRAKVTADEIGTIADSYNAMVDNLRRIVFQVQDAVDEVVTTTIANDTSVQVLSIEALQQAEAIANALDLVKDMASAVRDVAANAERAETVVQVATQVVDEGDLAMNRTVEGIQAIQMTVADTAKKVKHLGESSQRISKVVELISAFAAQTNMLAMNASIEASRAGEGARGFAVVANEVRSLARQSAEATQEIRNLVSSIQAETREVAEAMEAGIEQVATGTKLVDDTRQSLNKITAVSAQINQLVEAIAQATVVQSHASETVAQTMQDVATIANKTSTEAMQVSSSFGQLQHVARTLKDGVGQFKVS